MQPALVVVLVFAVVVSLEAASRHEKQESATSQLESRKLVQLLQAARSDEAEGEFDFRMPNVSPKQKDVYLCHEMTFDSNKTMYITEIVPYASTEIIHHMAISGCTKPASFQDVWDCPVFYDTVTRDNPACHGDLSFVYRWAKGTPTMKLPEGVGLKVNGDTGIHYLVMQIHYNNVDRFLNGAVDQSGVRIKYTFKPLPYTATLLTVGTGGIIQPGQEEHFEVACLIDEDVVLHPFAFRTHTHQLGLVVTGYRVRNNEWTEIGRRSPQLPNEFVPANPVTLKKGDVVAARCTMFNYKAHAVSVGPTDEEEMCIFHMLYYADRAKTLSWGNCDSKGPPLYYWKNDKSLSLSNIPADASAIPPPPNGPDPTHVVQQHHGHGK